VACKTGAALGPRKPIDAELHANPRRRAVWFAWPTAAQWAGCRDLEVTTTDGVVHAARFREETRPHGRARFLVR
jgi:hypothetical protein